MFKKSFFVLFVFLLGIAIFASPKAEAFTGKPDKPYSQNATYTVTAISENDFTDNVDMRATGLEPNQWAEFFTWDTEGYFSNQWRSVGHHQANAEGIIDSGFTSKWATHTLPHTYLVKVKARPKGATTDTGQATYQITVNPATISMTASPEVTDGSSVDVGSKVTFTCTNSSQMYFGSQSNWSAKQTVEQDEGKADGSGATKSYTLKHTFTFNDPGDYKVECVNVGGDANSKVKTFSVKAAAPTTTATLTATNCTIVAGAKSCTSKLTWTTANPVGVSSITSNTPSANTTITTGNNGTNYSVTVNSGSRTFYLYNNSQELDRAIVTASCDTGLEADVNGLCHAPCQANYAWNPNTKKCEFSECDRRAS